jgi:hypothetical protein
MYASADFKARGAEGRKPSGDNQPNNEPTASIAIDTAM